MRTRFAALLAVTALAAACAGPASAGVVNFNGHTVTEALSNDFTEGGLHFFGGQSYFVPPGDANFPAASTFLETASEPLIVTLTAGGDFDLVSVKLGLDAFNTTPTFDFVTVTGTKGAGCSVDCTVTANLQVGYGFASYALAGFTGLSSVSFGMQQMLNSDSQLVADSGYLAFDDFAYLAPGDMAIPEPATWAMLLLGFFGTGALLRGARRKAAFA
jgi:hypothetical protein